MFAIAARVGLPVESVEAMSHRQVVGWMEFMIEEQGQRAESIVSQGPSVPSNPNEGAIPYSMLSKAAKRSAFR